MMNKLKKVFGFVFIGAAMIFLHVFTINKIFKDPTKLKNIQGRVTDQYLIKIRGRSSYDAVILELQFQKFQFAFHDKYERVFSFLKNNSIINKDVTITFDPAGYNSEDNLTYHVYGLLVDGEQLLTLEESSRMERIVLYILLAIDILILYFVTRKYIKRRSFDKSVFQVF